MTLAQSYFLSGSVQRAHLEQFGSYIVAGIIYAVGNKAVFTWLTFRIEEVWVCVSGKYVSKTHQVTFPPDERGRGGGGSLENFC